MRDKIAPIIATVTGINSAKSLAYSACECGESCRFCCAILSERFQHVPWKQLCPPEILCTGFREADSVISMNWVLTEISSSCCPSLSCGEIVFVFTMIRPANIMWCKVPLWSRCTVVRNWKNDTSRKYTWKYRAKTFNFHFVVEYSLIQKQRNKRASDIFSYILK